MAVILKVPVAERLVWANVTRPTVPLVYLDLNTIIYFARENNGKGGPKGYSELLETVRQAKREGRALFPLGESHLWEVSKIANPKQRAQLAGILEELSDFNYLLGRVSIAELEFDAGIAAVMGETPRNSAALVRPTSRQLFGNIDGTSLIDIPAIDRLHALLAETESPPPHLVEQARAIERYILQGPSDDDIHELRKDPDYRPERAIASHRSRVAFELETQRVLNQAPHWRQGRLRDVIGGREVLHEWGDLLAHLRVERVRRQLPAFDPSNQEFRDFMGALPHTQVAISLKTHLHRNPQHVWTSNDITDIDAMSVAFAYCDAVFPDKAIRQGLLNAKELHVFNTFVPRGPSELVAWLDALPSPGL